MQIKKDYAKMIEQFEKMEKEKQAAIPTISFDNNKIVHLPVDLLKPFPNHPFELYSGERFEDLADSIKACGMITPLLIRMLDDNTYQILAGHNRNNAAKAIGLETVPCIVLTDLTDDDALMIMLDSNTNQRSISEMSISQQAHIYALDVAVNKRQGKRSDLIKNIEQNLKIFSNGADLETCTPVGNKLKTVEIVGDKYGVSKNTIARLIRIDTLLPQLKKFIDNNALKNSAAKLISRDSIALVTRVGVGKVAVINQDFTTSQDFLSLSDFDGNDIKFIAYQLFRLMQENAKVLQGTSIKGISKTDLIEQSIAIPNSIKEQNLIASLLSQTDSIITLHQQEPFLCGNSVNGGVELC